VLRKNVGATFRYVTRVSLIKRALTTSCQSFNDHSMSRAAAAAERYASLAQLPLCGKLANTRSLNDSFTDERCLFTCRESVRRGWSFKTTGSNIHTFIPNFIIY